ncbi:MAG: hypothetical protein Q8S57_02715 [Methanoregula sp.]|nr:hypothetical protein [Methanoregula sp.]MDP3395570.1 hypothetical protein [Methanoregula sp.]
MTLVIRAYFTLLPAYLPVLFCIFYRIFAGIYHEKEVGDDG